MKKTFFLFAMLISISAFTQNINVENISATYTGTPTVKFRVSWTGARTYRHNTNVWVFVDYQKVEGNAPSGIWTRAAVASTPMVSSSPASTATLVSGNNQGFWLNGVDGNYSATVTVSLSGVPAQFNWCAYATDYPPNAEAKSSNSYTLHGTPPFVVNETKLGNTITNYSGTITTFTDATCAPGIFPAGAGEEPNAMGCMPGLVINTDGKCVTATAVGCNTTTSINMSGAGFASSATYPVGNQIWSSPVTVTACAKTSFTGVGNADCRHYNTSYGHYFSWCAFIRYAGQLCPSPWRVPTNDDYCTLHKNLTGAANCATTTNATYTTLYRGTKWNALFAGIADNGNGEILSYGAVAQYWNNNQHSTGKCTVHRLGSANLIALAESASALYGRVIRCVR
jgi:uncharacterized protein (TIGR02145 family)